MNPSSPLCALEAAREAVAIALPSMERMLTNRTVSVCGVLHLVVLDPALVHPRSGFDQAVAYEHSVGDRQQWRLDHAALARDKALVSWQHQMDSRRVVPLRHYWLIRDETMLWGGVWLDGCVVAASGALPAWNEAFALTVASNLRALAIAGADPGGVCNA